MSGTKFLNSIPEDFWQVIEQAEQNREKFRELLEPMNRGKLARMHWTYEELASRIRGEDYWRHADTDLSEDGMWELANWVVAQGKQYYQNVYLHPEQIPPKKNDVGFVSDLVLAYENRYQADIPLNTHLWDEDWKQHGKKSPWSYDAE